MSVGQSLCGKKNLAPCIPEDRCAGTPDSVITRVSPYFTEGALDTTNKIHAIPGNVAVMVLV